MSKEIAQTVSGLKIAWLIAILAAFAVLATIGTTWRSADAVDPPLAVSFAKVGSPDAANLIYYTLVVENSTPQKITNPNTESQTIETVETGLMTFIDPLPSDVTWWIAGSKVADSPGDSINCNIDLSTNPPSGQLVCTISNLDGRHLNDSQTAFVNGRAEVVIYGLTKRCGSFTNSAVLYGNDLVKPLTATGTVVDPCPATPTPTSTSTPTPTNTPNIIVVTATPTNTVVAPTATPSRIVPLPPNTGDGAPPTDRAENNVPYGLFALLFMGAIAFGAGGLIVSHRSK